MSAKPGLLATIQEYSLPLIGGVFAALALANLRPELYHHWVHAPWVSWELLGHEIDLDFVINDIFMVFFFGIAAKEITDAVLPGGALNPPAKAVNPLLGTIGGVLGPVGVFFLLVHLIFDGHADYAVIANGWGVPTATDIALAWLAARLVFGARHPAVNFLLLLAVADDAIGLGIIAVFYPDPAHPVAPIWLLCTLAGMLLSLGLRLRKDQRWGLYVLLGGGLSWLGLIEAHLHPALALVFIVPFLPTGKQPHLDLISEEQDQPGVDPVPGPSPLERFERTLKLPVDLGLFLFAFANAGVQFANLGALTWIILASLLIGKTVGIFSASFLASKIGFGLPDGMDLKTLGVAGLVAGLGLTVALFVSAQAYTDGILQGEAKMGALFSGAVFGLALIAGRLLGVRKIHQ